MRPDTLPALAKWTSEDGPDPDTLPVVTGWKILVRPISLSEKTKTGIYIPDQAKDDAEFLTTVGRVLAMGPLCYTRKDMLVDGAIMPWAEVGSYVVYPKYGGAKFMYDKCKMLVMNDDEVLMVVDNPDKLKVW